MFPMRGLSLRDCRRLINQLTGSLEGLNWDPRKTFRLIVAGIPNVGKSTLINGIRTVCCGTDVKAVRTGSKPGVTRGISEQVKLSEEPKVYLLDTPGVLVPKIEDPDVGLRLGITGMKLRFPNYQVP